MEDETNVDSIVQGQSIVFTIGHNIKVGLPNYSSEDVYEGVKVELPIPTGATPEAIKALMAKFVPTLREAVLLGVVERADELKGRNNVKPKIDEAKLV